MERPTQTYADNVALTQELLELARIRGVVTFLLASTNAVVGDVGTTTITEGLPLRPLTPYGATKAACEMFLSGYAGAYGMTTCALRFSNVYGPGMAHKDSFVPRLMRAALTGSTVQIYGDGSQRRDLVHVDDVARAVLLGWDTGYTGSAIIGSGRSVSVLDLVDTVRRVTERPLHTEHVAAQQGEMPAVVLDLSHSADVLGYRPTSNSRTGSRAPGATSATRSGRNRVTRLADYPDEVDTLAVTEFHRRYRQLRLAELVVVIAAYNEAAGIGSVLADIPKRCCDMVVDVLVVVDGATDETAEIARKHGVYTCVAPRNRGQGAALRLGYRLAADCGARYVVTTDADGQYDSAEMATLVRPLVEDRADFVTGSRRLGPHEADSRVRWIGVRVFAMLASLLTWRRITDTSFGFRAMRADLACSVTLVEPQYQSSELLLGVTARGARVLEVPMTMHLRGNGASKKGGNLIYGANYARVMMRTWIREYVLRGRRR